jgi:hypothetical protein
MVLRVSALYPTAELKEPSLLELREKSPNAEL